MNEDQMTSYLPVSELNWNQVFELLAENIGSRIGYRVDHQSSEHWDIFESISRNTSAMSKYGNAIGEDKRNIKRKEKRFILFNERNGSSAICDKNINDAVNGCCSGLGLKGGYEADSKKPSYINFTGKCVSGEYSVSALNLSRGNCIVLRMWYNKN